MKTASLAAAPARLAYLTAGWMAVGLAFAGLVVPGMPSTVFVLIASYCFSRSSARFSRWLWEHRWLGPRLRRYVGDGGLSRQAKRAAIAAMWTSVAVSAALLFQLHPLTAIATVALGVVGTLSIVFVVRTVPGDA